MEWSCLPAQLGDGPGAGWSRPNVSAGRSLGLFQSSSLAMTDLMHARAAQSISSTRCCVANSLNERCCPSVSLSFTFWRADSAQPTDPLSEAKGRGSAAGGR